ncbi:methyltransferase [Deinococcus sonorensis]|uniref:Methyltransferase n=2 Tax=Deinococcus sonorensis TaxID=309891 RepID=A0AAU7UA74_9DEIO
MNEPEASARPSDHLLTLLNGYRVSQALHVAATLGIADLLAGGPLASAELAERTGSHPGSLYRLLRALADAGVLAEHLGQRFGLTATGEALRSDAPDSLAGMARFIGRPYIWQAWSGLLHSVQTGENAFAHLNGESLWAYWAQRPEENRIFDAAMTGNTRRAQHALLERTDFGRYGTVIDVGGGRGTLLIALLQKFPDLKGVLFDQPQVVAHAGPLLTEAGLAERCRVVSGSFFEGVPPGGGAYLLKAVLHDWDDEQAIQILQRCHEAMAPGASLLVIERRMDQGVRDRHASLSDLNMLVGPGGRERTTAEFRTLFEHAGFTLTDIRDAGYGFSIIEGVPV